MQVRQLLDNEIAHNELCPGALTAAEWSEKTWLEARVDGKLYPIFPMWPIRDAISKHDIHHILTGYDTTMHGEAELAAWELGAGGCAFNLLFWVDRIAFSIIGLCTCPKATFRAFRRGIRCRNLFGQDLKTVLDAPVADIRGYLNVDA